MVTRQRSSSTIPFGYGLSEDNKTLEPIELELETLRVVATLVESNALSLREGSQWIEHKTGRPLSHVGLKTIKNPENYRTNEDGSFVLKKDGSPRKKTGRPKGSKSRGYNYHSETKAKIKAKRSVRIKEKQAEKMRQRLVAKRDSLNASKETLNKLDRASASKVVTEDILDKVPKALKEEVNNNVIFKPNVGPQTDFLAAPERDVLYGGAAGGGKSYAMLIDPLRFAHRSAHRALILRRSMPELRELIDKSRELYPRAFPGCKYKEVEKLWNFPSGAKVEFGFLERDADVYRYQGQAYSWIGFDEITHLPTEFGWNYLASRLRTTDPEIETYMRCTANPGGVGATWVKKRYVDPYPPNETFTGADNLTRKFIPARLQDNPYLAHDGRYEEMLKALPPTQRKQLLLFKSLLLGIVSKVLTMAMPLKVPVYGPLLILQTEL